MVNDAKNKKERNLIPLPEWKRDRLKQRTKDQIGDSNLNEKHKIRLPIRPDKTLKNTEK